MSGLDRVLGYLEANDQASGFLSAQSSRPWSIMDWAAGGRRNNVGALWGEGMPILNVDEHVAIVDADPKWPAQFHDEAKTLRLALGSTAVAVEHIGSTAVPGLAAKPILDILIGAAADRDDDTLAKTLRGLRYQSLGEAGLPGRLYFSKRGVVSCNVHVVLFDGKHWKTNLAVRDFLRAHPKRALEYAALKREAAKRSGGLLAYSQYKSEFMDELVRTAMARQDGV